MSPLCTSGRSTDNGAVGHFSLSNGAVGYFSLSNGTSGPKPHSPRIQHAAARLGYSVLASLRASEASSLIVARHPNHNWAASSALVKRPRCQERSSPARGTSSRARSRITTEMLRVLPRALSELCAYQR